MVDGTVLHMDVIDERRLLFVIVDEGEHVHIGDGVAHNFAFCSEIVERQPALFQHLCLLKLHVFGLFFHFFAQFSL